MSRLAEQLYEHIKHGDDEHKAWLKKEVDEFFSKRKPKTCFDPGPWDYKFEDQSGVRLHYVESSGSGKDFDLIRLYLNGPENMTRGQYIDYGYKLATFLNYARQPLDSCTRCNGAKGGIPGNENLIDGKSVCDYCS